MNARKLIPLLLIAAGLCAYHNSFQGGFIFDDANAIGSNPHVRHLWPLWEAMSAPEQSSASGRPTVSFSLAVNYALGGLDTWGYHACNVSVHLLCALLLFGIVRRTLENQLLREHYGNNARWLAMAVALIWMVHPLQTESVNYIIQRTELFMAFFFLLTLYCVIRGWHLAAIVACVLGMGSKEVMVAAPLVVMLYDRTFMAGSFRESFRQRWRLYTGLFGAWLPLTLLVWHGQARTMSEGFGRAGLSSWMYAKTQCGVIVHYLGLSIWPHPLVVDYDDWPLTPSLANLLPAGIFLSVLLAATLWALRHRPPLGFLGGWFFLILAPTSSFLPIATELAAERRMYLPLAALVVLILLAVHRFLERLEVLERRRVIVQTVLCITLACVLGFLTVHRNVDYREQATLMRTVLAVRPNNARAHYNLAISENSRNPEEAIAHYLEALRIAPTYVDAHNNLAILLASRGQLDEAIAHFTAALRASPNLPEAHNNLGASLATQGKIAEALSHFDQALRLKPDYADARRNREIASASQ